MKTRSAVAHWLLLLSIGVMAAGCAHTDTKINVANTADSASSARGTATPAGAAGRHYVNALQAEDSSQGPGALAQAEKMTPETEETEADMARAMLFFPVFGVRVPIW
jgi:hypothetical protein